MMRFRRYRVFAILSFVLLVLLYKSSQPANWDLDWRTSSAGGQYANKVPDWHTNPEGYRDNLETNIKGKGGNTEEKPLDNTESGTTEKKPVEEEQPKQKEPESNTPTPQAEALAEAPIETPTPEAEATKDATPVKEETATSTTVSQDAETEIPTIPKPHPGGQHDAESPHEDTILAATPSPVHWEPQEENFPVAEQDIIALPTASAESIPRIQFNFGEEDPDDKEIREGRLAKVKAEMQHAWKGYSTYAWGHDELMPVSLKHKDPFCGWAATLVDSLDTLWIMGMKDEFDKAVKEVAEIDFTFTPHRPEIPVFETTIRYLGGLLGAYDMAGGASGSKDYGILLEKAGELAEILMGIFDTPNRMPILYYDYKPQSVSKPKLAPTRAGVAELGSLLMEFTRLAQLSGKHKYYDAVARITNALDDLGKRTDYTGLFPETLDVSGCNRTAVEASVEDTEQIIPGLNPSLSKEHAREDAASLSAGEKRDSTDQDATDEANLGKRDSGPATKPSPRDNVEKAPKGPTGSSRSPPRDLIKDCRQQPLVSGGFGSESYSIGGSQDSTYEYFPKEYLLLGAREPQYKRLSIDALEATKNYLLFRPMIPDDRDILFSAKIVTRRNGNPDYTYESTHLACFVGGMFGMAAKIFDKDEYLDLGKRLTDGCVWAYDSFPSGIMPEGSRVVPCSDPNNCPWDEDLWHKWIDPAGDSKDVAQKDYDQRRALRLEQEKADEEAAKARAEEEAASPKTKEEEDAEVARKNEAALQHANHFASVVEAEAERQAKLTGGGSSKAGSHATIADEDIEKGADELLEQAAERTESLPEKNAEQASSDGTDSAERAEKKPNHQKENPLRRREVSPEAIGAVDLSARDSTAAEEPTVDGEPTRGEHDGGNQEEDEQQSTPAPKSKEEAEALAANPPPAPAAEKKIKETSANQSQKPVVPYDPETDLARPLNHTQFVAKRIKEEGLAKGFVSITSRDYILRPEAIESVWYMYRITGDKIWQEKGWKMFQSIIKATKTEAGHSAVRDITSKNPIQNDSMESFWLAETLKYFYLLFAEPDVVSLDEWVLNTEAHPFKRPKPQSPPPATSAEGRPLDE